MYKAIVTGASSGIGKAIYEGLKIYDDMQVLGLSRRGPDIVQDLRDELPDTSLEYNVDLLINCAGVMPLLSTKASMDDIFNVNFWGMVKMIRNLSFNSDACIINIASVSGMMAEPNFPIYAASKAAVISYTKSLAKFYAPKIRVNCISPGFYKTNLVPGDPPKELIEKIPMGYEELPEKLMTVVNMIWNTKYMTGSNIVVDGGLSL